MRFLIEVICMCKIHGQPAACVCTYRYLDVIVVSAADMSNVIHVPMCMPDYIP